MLAGTTCIDIKDDCIIVFCRSPKVFIVSFFIKGISYQPVFRPAHRLPTPVLYQGSHFHYPGAYIGGTGLLLGGPESCKRLFHPIEFYAGHR